MDFKYIMAQIIWTPFALLALALQVISKVSARCEEFLSDDIAFMIRKAFRLEENE